MTALAGEPDRKFRGAVLHVLAPGHVGGLESVVRLLAAGQANRGSQVAVLAILDAAGPEPAFLDQLRAAGVDVHARPVPPRRYGLERATIREVCRVVAPAVVHTHGYRADVLAAGVARSLGLSTATTVHGFTGGDLKNRMYEWLQRRSYRRYGAVVAVSRPLVELLAGSGVARRRIHLIPNAWSSGAAGLPRDEARRRLGVAEGVFLVGWVGRFGREKGADLLLEALARLRGSGVQAAIIGDGRERRALAVQADRLGLSECVRWHGAVPDAARLFSAFDCFVLSSRTEGTPMVLFEAMAARAPIVAARVGGVPDVVGPREALLVDPESPAALAAAVEQVRTDRADAERRAAAAEARLHTHFALGPWLDGYEAVYEALTHVRPLIRTS